MKTSIRKSTLKSEPKNSSKDAVRLMIAVVCILFASLASVDHETPAERRQAQDLVEAKAQRDHARELKRAVKLPEAPHLLRINGSI